MITASRMAYSVPKFYKTQKSENKESNKLSFGSVITREQILAQQKAIEEARRKELERQEAEYQAAKAKTMECLKYKGLDDIYCKEMAKFTLNFACEMVNNTNHVIEEFFGSDEDAAKIRSKYSPECQKDSIELRNAVKGMAAAKDPILCLITAANLRRFAPKQNVLDNKELTKVLDTTKKACIDMTTSADFKDCDVDDIGTINELLDMIKNSEGVDFGDEYNRKLQGLIDKKNCDNKVKEPPIQTQVFIPPVQVKHHI